MKPDFKKIKIVFENPSFIIIDKPAGISVHGGVSVKEKTLVDFLVEKYPEIKNVGEDPDRPGIVHRLDKDTSGLMIVARNHKTFEVMKKKFKNREIQKKYLALCWGKFKKQEDCIKSYIGRSLSNPVRQSQSKNPDKVRNPKEAITFYKVLQQGCEVALVEADLKTGRMHQIRVHLHSIGHSVVGDKKYQTKKIKEKNKSFPRHYLHSFFLKFSFGEKENYEFKLSMPDDFKVRLEKKAKDVKI